MSVLGRRLAGTEGAYFLQESKNAVGRLATQKTRQTAFNKREQSPLPPAAETGGEGDPLVVETSADVLPEILRHSIPLQHQQEVMPSSFTGGAKWSLGHDSSSSRRLDGVINPLRDYVALPQVTFGPKRWQLPDAEGSVLASTANELRREGYQQPVDPEKLKAAAAGLSQIGKAFAIATSVIFGGATFVLALTASKLEIQTTDDLRTRGRDLIHPRADAVRENLAPLRTWAEKMSRKWRYSGQNEAEKNTLVQRVSKTLESKDL